MTKRELALDYFNQGYNCSQAVLLAFSKEMGLTPEQIARLGSSFGGGVARLQEMCGAVSAMAMVAGLKEGYESPTDGEGKAAHYERVRGLATDFQKKNGSYICRELLAEHPMPAPEPGKAPPTHNPACWKFVGDAADILEGHLKEQGKV